MKRFILFSVFISLLTQEDAGCPNSTASWKKMETTYNCGRNLFYHCLRDERQRKIQMCLRRSWIEPGFCPVYSTFAHKIDAIVCADSLKKCPTSTFWSNEPYKYPACLKAFDVENSKATDRSDLINNQSEREEKNTNGSGMVVGIIAVIIIAIAALIAYLCFKKKGRRSQQKKNKAHSVNGIGKKVSKDEERTLIKTDLNESEIAGTGEKQVITRKPNLNKTLTPAETIEALINENLTEEGGILLFVGDNLEEKVKKNLKGKDENFTLINSIGHCSAISEQRQGYVLITCFMTIGVLSASLFKSDDINKMEVDIKSHGHRAIILVGKDVYSQQEHELSKFELFKNVTPMFI